MKDKLSITELHSKFKDKELSPLEFAKYTISLLQNDTLNCITAFDEEAMIQQAKASERRYFMGVPASKIDGVPIGIKDIINTAGLVTTYGCAAYSNHIPENDAHIITALKKAGAITYIKTNTCQFALGPTGEECLHGAVRNPHNADYYTGGSSSGSAAAVAAGLLPAAVGTDSGGSIRMPASLCGVVGMKPTYSLISNTGILAVSDSVDTAGTLTNNIPDSAALLQVLASYNSRDWRQSLPPGINYSQRIGDSITDVSAVIMPEMFENCYDEEISAGCMRAVKLLRNLGCAVTEKPQPDLRELQEAHQISMLAYAHSLHTHDITENRKFIYTQILTRLQKGDISSSLYIKLARKKKELNNILFNILGTADCLLYPTTPVTAFPIGSGSKETVINNHKITPYAVTGSTAWIGSFSGLPCLHIPIGKTKKGLPYGLSLLGRRHDEANLYRIGYTIMNLLD